MIPAIRRHRQRASADAQAIQSLRGQIVALGQDNSALSEQVARQDREIRQLTVGHGATFDELDAAGKIGTGAPYQFDDLLSFRRLPERSAPIVPPLVFIHVPKAGGTTLNNVLMKSYKFRADSYGSNFFPRYFPNELVSFVEAPEADDDRARPVFFTGHIGLDNELFQRMPVRYVTVTMLRDPVQRVISHYRFNSTVPSIFQSAILDGNLRVADYFQRFRAAIPLQYELFAPRAENEGGDDPAGRVEEALRNLESRVSLFGLQDHYDEFVVLLAELLGLPDVFYTALNKTPADAAAATPEETDDLRGLLASEIEFYQGAVSLYRRRIQTLTFDLAARVRAFREAQAAYLALSNREGPDWHPWKRFYA